MLNKDIFLSIKPEYTEKIENRTKPYELRNINSRYNIDKFYIYESAPISSLTYIAEVGEPIIYPDKINEYGSEAERFNRGLSKYKKAFPILHLWKLEKPIHLEILKNEFNFNAPQGFIYSDTYELLTNHIIGLQKHQIF